MSMNNANYMRSPCEVIRLVNDMFQGDSALDEKVRYLLAEAELKSKLMSIELSKHNDSFHHRWPREPLYDQRIKLRKSPGYKFYKMDQSEI